MQARQAGCLVWHRGIIAAGGQSVSSLAGGNSLSQRKR